MQEPNKKQDKIEAQEIHIGGVKRKRESRPRGKLGTWLENFWYHHKWKVIIAFSFTVIALICTLQMCSKEKQDTSVLLVGPYQLSDSEAGYTALKHTLATYLPENTGRNGSGNVGVVHYGIYSKEQIEALAQNVDENGDPAPISIDTALNTQNYSQYREYLMTGETSVLFLDPWLFEELKKMEDPYLVNIKDRFKTVPVGALNEEDGACYGVRLGDTALYRNSAVSAALPPDTVIALAHKHFYASEKSYDLASDYFASLVGLLG